MADIQQLSPSVVNKIAAGEVIERPASVVKELVENSVDAGASRVAVAVAKGGTERICVSDNGCGIAGDQLWLAVASHATSKIRDADDLFRVGTLGFRGEALASVAEVSQLRIRSRTSDETAGAELEVHGGQLGDMAPCGCAVGTSIEVRNLFFNTPVRRKFMRTVQTEMGHVSEAFSRIALAYDDVHFTLSHNDRSVYDLPATADWRSRIGTLFGHEISDSLLWVEGEDGPIRICGYVADPSQNRGNNRMQFIFLNQRHIRDRSLAHALAEGYRGLIMTGRYPIAFLRLEMPPELVDVNVHPTKLEVRFQDGGQVYRRLLGALRNRFLTTDLTAHVQSPGASPSQFAAAPPANPPGLSAPAGVSPAARDPQPFAVGPIRPAVEPRQSELDLPFQRPPLAMPGRGSVAWSPTDNSPAVPQSPIDAPGLHDSAANSPPAVTPAYTSEGTPALQVCNRYLITETPDGVVVIDQHALHERILYEQLREKVLSESVEVQRLLVPEPVQLTPAEAAIVLERKSQLAQLGIEVESFGGDTILISAYPAMLANISPAEVLRGVAEQLMTPENQPDRRDLLDSLLHMISCKAAIKAGERLSNDEISALIQHRHVVQDSHHCPHGRPTTLVFTRDELDRRFKRI